MIKRLVLFLLISVYSVDSFSSHAAGMDLTYECLTTDTVWTGNYQVTISTGAFGNECSWNITDNITGAVISSGSGYNNNTIYNINVCIPSGNFTFNWFDSWGDGWNGGSYTVTTNTGTVLTSGTPPNGASGSSSFTSPGSSCTYSVTNYPANTYRVTLKFYRDCSNGIPAPGSFTLNYSSSSCSSNNNSTMNQISFDNVTPVCVSITDPCNEPGVVGIEEYVYQTIITLPNNCTDWILSVCESVRNGAITTLTNTNVDLCVQAVINNTNNYQNSSPIFTNAPANYLCVNTPSCYNNGAFDPDGDSLVYSLSTPLTSAAGATVNYIAPYSAINPISGATTFDPLTGDLCTSPNQIQVSVVAMKVSEYRNGVFIGSVMRDIQIIILNNCSTPPPNFSNIDTTIAFDTTLPSSSFNFCTDGVTPITFNINTVNPTNSPMIMSWDNPTAIPGGTFQVDSTLVPGSSPPQWTCTQGIFTWLPTLADTVGSPFLFTVKIEDYACPLSQEVYHTFPIYINTNYIVSGSPNNISCYGGNDGSIDISAVGGVPPITYNWTGPNGFSSIDDSIKNLEQGSYSLSIIDGDGCEDNQVITLTEPPELVITTFTGVDIFCHGDLTGAILLISGGGVPPYTYLWNNGATTQNLTGIGAGTYSVTITDAIGCIEDTSITLTEPLIGLSSSITGTNLLCKNDNTGAIDLTVNGGTTPYDFLWTGPGGPFNTEDLSSLSAGTYSVAITDSNGCWLSTNITLTEPNTGFTSSISGINLLCFSDNTGSINLTVNGGTSPYIYMWNDGSTIQNRTGLSAGIYSVIITDANSCTNTQNITLTEPADLTLSTPYPYSDLLCFGNHNGFIDLTISGGTSPLVSWTSINGYTSSLSSITNLSPDTYTATITDANGCGPITETVVIDETSEITISATVSDNSCFNSNDASIDLLTSGNNLIFNWAGPSSFSSNQEDIFNLISGIYIMTITDDDLCTHDTIININEPSDIIVTYISNNVSCFAGTDGFIDLTISGGVGNYTTTWTGSNGYSNVSDDIFSLSAGDYFYTIIDDNGCSPSVNNPPITITEPLDIQLSTLVKPETCYGDLDGGIDITLIGPSTYTYSWVGPNNFTSTNDDISNLAAGTYTLEIKDLSNCVSLYVGIVDIGNSIYVDSVIKNITCYGDADGDIKIITPTSIAPTFIWELDGNPFSSISNQISNLEAGNYSVYVNDQTNCLTRINLNISEPQPLSLSSNIENESCDGYQDGQIEVVVSGGTLPYTYLWNNTPNNTAINSNLINGVYTVSILDSNTCFLPQETFQVDLFLFDTIRKVTNVSCFGGADGTVKLEIVGGNSPFTYLWSNGDSTDSIFNLSSGVYTVDITDATNCTIIRDVVVLQPPQQLAAVTYDPVDVLCFGDSTGSIRTTIVGGTYPYFLDWGSSDTSAMWAGDHGFTVTDNNGCLFTDSINIKQNDSMQITSVITDVQCYGDFNGSLQLQITQGTAPYDYEWYGPNNYFSDNEDIYNLESGNYLVIITDDNLCSQSRNLFVDHPPTLSQDIEVNTSNYSGYNVACKGGFSAWVKISVSGGYPPFTYLWSNGSYTDSIFNLYAGNYSLQITDSLGCIEDLSLNLDEPPTYVTSDIIATSDYNGYNISCFGSNDGSVFIEASNGVPPYTYLWNTEDVKDSITGLYQGYYEVLVYDKNLCLSDADIDSVTLIEPSELFFDLFSYPDTCEKSVGKAEFIASGGVPGYSAIWSDSSIANIINNYPEGMYSIEVSDLNSCKKSESFRIDNLESPIADFEAYPYHKRLCIQKNDPFYFTDLTQTFWSSVKDWKWDFDYDGISPIYDANDSLVSHSYDVAGIYRVKLEITTFANCIDTISKEVLVDEYSFYIPTTFRPLSKFHENRIFKGYGIGIEEYELKIFSNWGGLIFKSNDLDVGWNGTHQTSGSNDFNEEDLLPAGVYTYTVFIKNIYGEIFESQGQVTLYSGF